MAQLKHSNCCSILCFSIFFILSLTVFGQNRRFILKGKVIDRISFSVIPGANITISETRRGCSSDQKGEFSITLYKLPVYVNVSHLGYESQRIWLDTATGPITFMLNLATHVLNEVEIKSINKAKPVYKDNRYSVLDFVVDSNRVFLLVYRSWINRSELLCQTMEGDTVARSGIFTFKPTSLFRDCLGNLHILSDDSAYQVYRQRESFFLYPAAEVKKFRMILGDCVASNNNNLFFRKESPDQLSVEFIQVDRQTHQKKLLTSASDDKKIKMLRQNPEEYELLLLKEPPREYEKVLAWQWLKKIVYGTNRSSLQRFGDMLCMINTSKFTLETHTMDGVLTSKLKMPVQDIHEGKWTSEIYYDEIENKAYTSFLTSGGNFTLYKINMNNGELKRIINLEQGFPKKIRIYKGMIFFLYDIPGVGDNQHLLRQKL